MCDVAVAALGERGEVLLAHRPELYDAALLPMPSRRTVADLRFLVEHLAYECIRAPKSNAELRAELQARRFGFAGVCFALWQECRAYAAYLESLLEGRVPPDELDFEEFRRRRGMAMRQVA